MAEKNPVLEMQSHPKESSYCWCFSVFAYPKIIIGILTGNIYLSNRCTFEKMIFIFKKVGICDCSLEGNKESSFATKCQLKNIGKKGQGDYSVSIS